jgi:putative transposase
MKVAEKNRHSRYVLSWEISLTMDSEFCVSALERALRCDDKPAIFNADQGAQYTGNDFTDSLKAHDIQISMDGKGRAMDNIFIERLWRSVKYEEVNLNEHQSVEQLRKALKIYFEFYNNQRPHQSFSGQTPAEIYFNQVKFELAA